MDLFEYIKSQLPQMPNVAIMKDLGASDKLVEYVRETTWNTNLGMMATLECESDEPSGGEVWYTGTIDTSTECEGDFRLVELIPTSIASPIDLYNNHEDYSIFVNGTEVIYHHASDGGKEFLSNPIIYVFDIMASGEAIAGVLCDMVGDVSVTVTHK